MGKKGGAGKGHVSDVSQMARKCANAIKITFATLSGSYTPYPLVARARRALHDPEAHRGESTESQADNWGQTHNWSPMCPRPCPARPAQSGPPPSTPVPFPEQRHHLEESTGQRTVPDLRTALPSGTFLEVCAYKRFAVSQRTDPQGLLFGHRVPHSRACRTPPHVLPVMLLPHRAAPTCRHRQPQWMG